MSDLRVGLVGLGMMGRNHARVLRSLDGFELVGIADPVADTSSIDDDAPVHDSVEALIKGGLDACVVAAPTADHERIGVLLADAGVHTLIEKPLAPTVEAASRLDTAFRRAGVVAAVGHIERFNPAVMQMRDRLEAGELGEIYQVATMRCGPFPGRVRDVGVIMDLATHDVDLATWIAGSPYRWVAAEVAHRSGRAHEDLVSATGRLENGVVTNHQVNWLSPMKLRRTVATGERGAFVSDTLTGDLTFYENGSIETTWDTVSTFRGVSEGDMTRFAFPKREPLAAELASFRDAILDVPGGRIVTLGEGLTVVQVAETLLASARDGRRMRVHDHHATS